MKTAASRRKRKERHIVLQGVVREALKDAFRVEIFPDGRDVDPFSKKVYVLAYPCGKMRHQIRIVIGDRVTVAVSKYDYTRGRIVWRAPAE